MARRFAEITFTPSVKAAQTRYGSRRSNEGFERYDNKPDRIGENEASFIEARDGFYQASVNEDGWPYVQFRGGPAGFLKVLDDRTIGYADFRGNVQYISVGNIADNDRVSLILMDYPNRRRLKIWARARLVHFDEDSELIERLEIPTYRANVERGVILTIEAMDWNCPQHITPRFTEEEINENIQPLLQRLEELENANQSSASISENIGKGSLELKVSAVRQLTPNIRAFEFRTPDGSDLPKVEAGSNLEIPIQLENGEWETRLYSISSNPARRDAFEIAVQLDGNSTGGSTFIHNQYNLGMTVKVNLIKNSFSLHDGARPSVLIAGGIGITPLKAMAQNLIAQDKDFQLHYAAKSILDMAYHSKLKLALKDKVQFYPSDGSVRMDIEKIIKTAKPESVFYVCGPERLIQAVRFIGNKLSIAEDRIVFENFKAPLPQANDQEFTVHLEKSGKDITVLKDQTILDALLDADVQVEYGCKSGGCGTCATKVIEGSVDHRDHALSDENRNIDKLMCPCISRSLTDKITLDL